MSLPFKCPPPQILKPSAATASSNQSPERQFIWIIDTILLTYIKHYKRFALPEALHHGNYTYPQIMDYFLDLKQLSHAWHSSKTEEIQYTCVNV
jgi:hypothetical protein